MKRIALVLIAVLELGATAFAQSDFTAATPQFLAFDLGAGFGYSLDSTLPSQALGVVAAGFKIAVLDNLGVGFDALISGADPLFAGIRLSYNFIPQAGAAIGFGVTGSTPEPAISLGFYGDLFQTRSAIGITSGLKIRFDYIAPTDDIAKGAIVFTPAFSFGL
jgi:hypothetical protein